VSLRPSLRHDALETPLTNRPELRLAVIEHAALPTGGERRSNASRRRRRSANGSDIVLAPSTRKRSNALTWSTTSGRGQGYPGGGDSSGDVPDGPYKLPIPTGALRDQDDAVGKRSGMTPESGVVV
jgi:hypothetical protein